VTQRSATQRSSRKALIDERNNLYKSFGSALERFHDESEYRLPMLARYVIDKEGIIRAADVNADYTIRPEPSETLTILRTLTAMRRGGDIRVI
jgi:peroxiredoxin